MSDYLDLIMCLDLFTPPLTNLGHFIDFLSFYLYNVNNW